MSADERRPRASAIIPAAGQGLRMGGELKQYRVLGDEPLLLRALRRVAGCPLVSEVVVVVPPGEEVRVAGMIKDAEIPASVSVVPGGAQRAESVRIGVAHTSDAAEILVVHDAVRPFITAEAVATVIEAAAEFGAASLAIPVSDTLRREDDGFFGALIDREGLLRVQTPQAFRRHVLLEAFESAGTYLETATDEASLVSAAGGRVRIVSGSSVNIKITTPDDWRLARMLCGPWDRATEEIG